MRPAVAITLAELGLTLGGVRTALNADKAFEMLHAGERESLDGQFDGSAPAEAEDLGAN
jgi:rsbT antagonist protein RsbS